MSPIEPSSFAFVSQSNQSEFELATSLSRWKNQLLRAYKGIETECIDEAIDIITDNYNNQNSELDLSEMNLPSLPPILGEFHWLTDLKLEDNQLEDLPEEIVMLKKLEVLDLSCNQLKGLPSRIGELTLLKDLCVWNNPLECLPYSLFELENIETLELRENTFLWRAKHSFSEKAMENLVRFECAPPSVDFFSNIVCNMPNLVELTLDCSHCIALTRDISKLVNLKNLRLERIKNLPDELFNLTNLREIVIEKSTIRSIPKDIAKLSSLENLEIESCRTLKELSSSIFEIDRTCKVALVGTALPEERISEIVSYFNQLRSTVAESIEF